jgi:tetratricopeptide (TPR) repeat protein
MAAILTPSQRSEQALAAYRDGDYETAAAKFLATENAYTTAGDSLTAAEMANNRSVALLKAGDAQGALLAAQGTDLIFATAGDLKRQAVALANQAAALEDLKKLDRALELYIQAAEVFKQAGEKDQRSYVLQRISTLQLRTGEQLKSLASMDAALDNKTKLTWKDRLMKGLLGQVFRMLRGG